MMESFPSITRFGFVHKCLAKSRPVSDSLDIGGFINVAVEMGKINTAHFCIMMKSILLLQTVAPLRSRSTACGWTDWNRS